MPTIAFYSDSRSFGGAEVSLGNLLSELDEKFDAVVCGVDREIVDRLSGSRPQARTILLPEVKSKSDASGFAANLRAIRELRPQIFHANLSVPSAGQYALAAATVTRQVRTIAVEQLPFPLENPLQLRLKRFTSKRLAAHIAVGDQAARLVEEFVGLPKGSVLTIHNGVPDVSLVPVPRRFEGPIIGTIGRLDYQKGYDVLLRAMAMIVDANLVIVGDGAERSSLERLAEDLGVSQRIRFEGWRDDARSFLTAFDVFVLPSRFEGFPLSIVEAMLARLPVVATRVGSVEEAVVNGETGIVIPIEDPAALAAAVTSVLQDSALRVAMAERARDRALAFTAKEMTRRYEQVFEQALL